MASYHTRWVRPPEHAGAPERIAIREALAFGKAVYDRRRALNVTIAELAGQAGVTVDEIECIEEGGTEPTIALLRRLAAALDSDVRLTPGHDLGSVRFEPHAAWTGAQPRTARPRRSLRKRKTSSSQPLNPEQGDRRPGKLGDHL